MDKRNHKLLFADYGAHVLVDGQFGSTGKGALAAFLAKKAHESQTWFPWVYSNAGPNSGHTFYTENGDKVVLKQLPTFAVASYLNGWAVSDIFLTAGAIIDPEILCKEAALYPGITIMVHPNAAVIDNSDKTAEHSGTIAAVAGTRSGTGAALARKVSRDPTAVFSAIWSEQHFPSNVFMGVPEADHWQDRIFVEVSQGFSLGLNSGFYPKVTSRECTVTQAIADAHLPARCVTKTYLTLRTYPIRVGNVDGFDSGGMYFDQEETTWEALGQTPELTTVTQRVRRVFTFSVMQAADAIATNDPDWVFVNFMNYLTDGQQADMMQVMEDLQSDGIPDDAGDPFQLLWGYGPTTKDIKF